MFLVFFSCILRFQFVYYWVSFIIAHLWIKFWINSFYHCIIGLFVFEYDQYGFSQLLELMEQQPFLKLVQVMCEVKSQTILTNLKNWDLVCMTQVTHILWLKSNQTEENMMILVYVIRTTNYTWFKSCNSITQITSCTWLESHISYTALFDSNKTSYMTWITSCSTFSCLILINFI